MKGRSDRTISQARMEPSRMAHTDTQTPMTRELINGLISTGQQPLPVVQGKVAGLAAAHSPDVPLGQLKGGGDHVQQRQDDQIDQQNDGDQYDDVVGICHHCLDLILQPPAF